MHLLRQLRVALGYIAISTSLVSTSIPYAKVQAQALPTSPETPKCADPANEIPLTKA